MEINPAAPATPAATPSATPKPEAKDEAAVPTTDFQTFLTLLTSQLRNQDPLKPMESTEFVAQLASFSSVEQQVRSNERLDRMLEVLSGGTADGLAAWIGREVRAPASARFEGVPVEVEVTPKADADRTVLVVKNDFDQVVARASVEPGRELVTWDGTGELGETLPNGAYRFSLESYAGETLLDTQDGRVFGAVTEVRLADGAPVLILEGGAKVTLADVTAVR